MTTSVVEPYRKCMIVSFYRKRESNTATYFTLNGDLAKCNEVCGLMEELQLQPAPKQWKLFIDSSKVRLKAVLLHNGNNPFSVSLAHAFHIKNSRFVEKMCYEDHQCNICVDL